MLKTISALHSIGSSENFWFQNILEAFSTPIDT